MPKTVLELHHEHFNLYVSNPNALDLYEKAKIRNTLLDDTSYDFTTGNLEIVNFESADNEPLIIKRGEKRWPVFFENSSYLFEVEFKEKFKPDGDPTLVHPLKSIGQQFNYRNLRFSGNINFGNDIGKFLFDLRYSLNNQLYKFQLEFEIFPIKLNYKRDYINIIQDIQNAYPLLVLDFMRKTFTGMKKGNEIKHEFIWWHVFQTISESLFKELNYILNHPHNRLVSNHQYNKKHRLKQLSPSLEEEYSNFEHDENHYYRVRKKILSIDTPENRFVKHAINSIFKTYKRVHDYIEAKYINTISNDFSVDYRNKMRTITQFINHRLWNSVGKFDGFKQESLVIQRRAGYAGFYRKYILLEQGLKFLNDYQKIETKNIAELYQIWCFIQLKEIIKSLTGVEPETSFKDKFEYTDWSTLRLEEAFSCFTFNLHGGEKIELLHEYTYRNSESDRNNLLRSYTEEQRPDITLRVYKKDLPECTLHTYLFDAKYRINTSVNLDINDDSPPADSINQMHRYRDALFFKTKNYYNQSEKGVIGGYILFPGEISENLITSKNYFKSIEEVNIGAFPLNMHEDLCKKIIRDFLFTKILGNSSSKILKDTPIQKYVLPEFPDGNVIVGAAGSDEQERFLKENKCFYHTPLKKNSILNQINKVSYFSHWQKNGKCLNLQRIKSINIHKRSELGELGYPIHDESEELYLVLELFPELFLLPNPITATAGHHFLRYSSLSSFLSAKTFRDFNVEF